MSIEDFLIFLGLFVVGFIIFILFFTLDNWITNKIKKFWKKKK